jgi:hypothetical protein
LETRATVQVRAAHDRRRGLQLPVSFSPLPRRADIEPRRARGNSCILPVDGFFEWKAIKGQKAKQPYAIAMKDGSPFGIGGVGELEGPDFGRMDQDFRDHHHGRERTRGRNSRLSGEADPGDLMRPFPAEPMLMWPISTRVNKPENDDPSIVEPLASVKTTV